MQNFLQCCKHGCCCRAFAKDKHCCILNAVMGTDEQTHTWRTGSELDAVPSLLLRVSTPKATTKWSNACLR